jgi:hypothetical protein
LIAARIPEWGEEGMSTSVGRTFQAEELERKGTKDDATEYFLGTVKKPRGLETNCRKERGNEFGEKAGVRYGIHMKVFCKLYCKIIVKLIHYK